MNILSYVYNLKSIKLNMNKTKLLLLVMICASVISSAQKPPLDHSVYDSWKSINSPQISADGKWVAYIISPQQGDGWLYIYNVSTGIKDSVPRGTRSTFSPDSKYIAYQVIPSYAETRAAKKKKLKEDKMPKNNLEIRLLSSNEVINVPRVKSFAVPEEKSYWMAYLLEKKTEEKKDTTSKPDSLKTLAKQNLKSMKPPEPEGTELVILNPVVNKEYRYPDVTEYVVAREGKTISFLQDIPDTTKVDSFRVNVFDSQKETSRTVFEGKGTVKKLTSDKPGNIVSFLYTNDTSKTKVYDLWISKASENAFKVVDTLNPALPFKWSVSENSSISFSDDGTRIYFGTARKPIKEPEDTLLEDEKYKLDIWSWNDDILQPMQKKQLDQELKRTYQAVYHIDRRVMLQLSDTLVPAIRLTQKGNSDVSLALSNLKYRKSLSWDNNNYNDFYVVNIETGTKKMVLENCTSQVFLSPAGNYLLIYDYSLKAWISMPAQGGETKILTTSIKFPLFDELNDLPYDPQPYGMAGWIDDNSHVLIYDRYDIWSLDLTGKENPVNISNNFGRNNNLRLRYIKLDPDAEFISRKDLLYLSAFNYDNKESGYYTLRQGKAYDPVRLVFEQAAFSRGLTKAKKADILLWQKETFSVSPELYIGDMTIKEARKISTTNPQQKNYNWITAELLEWKSFDNTKLQGILYKPENFDPSRKYPMIIYFYERSSDGLYSYIQPAPSASIINRTFAASNGYLVFVPDIPYKVGYPGQSCYNAVVSGTYSLLDRFDFIDREKLGLDGQSWGGYQIAWLVTQTDLFACAYAGAPVSNMISAYGGIRWESGMSRMFQYEQTQSRIGGTLWEKPVHFIENSPIFFVPKINTPLLIMHNDADGAVPWYQGIELFTALRRLNKPAWFLSYNEEAHNLVKRPNRKDISIRKMQFFDHYLKGAPMPYWMKYGISQTEKGKIDGYNLVND
jgi:dipeptidyl aminopeptidase/acylaminoacyl peptidase